MPSITHFEVPADDTGRAQEFYKDVFGWEFNEVPGMDYIIIKTQKHTGEDGMGGGMMKRMEPKQTITNYVEVDDIDAYTKKVEDNGGKVIVPKTAVPGMGYFIQFLDTENNVMAIWMNDSNAA